MIWEAAARRPGYVRCPRPRVVLPRGWDDEPKALPETSEGVKRVVVDFSEAFRVRSAAALALPPISRPLTAPPERRPWARPDERYFYPPPPEPDPEPDPEEGAP
jgi:hypothetical protein